MPVADFEVNLKDAISPSAKNATAQITQLEKAMRALETQATKAATLGNVGAISKMSTQYKALGAQVGMLKDQFPPVAQAAEGAGFELASLPGPLGKLGSMGSSLGPLLANPIGLAAVALVALTMAAVAAAAAIGAIIFKAAEFALGVTEANNAQRALMAAWTGGPAAGQQMIDTLDGLRSSLGMTRAELVPLAQQLLQAGVKTKDVAAQLRTLAGIKVIGGDAMAEKYIGLLKKLNEGAKVGGKALLDMYEAGDLKDLGKGVEDIAKQFKAGKISADQLKNAIQTAMDAKSAAALAAKANTLPVIFAKLKEDLADLFDLGDGADGFMSQLKDLANLFDKNSAMAKTLKLAITTALRAIFDVGAKVLPYIKVGLLQIMVWGIKAAIFIRDHWSTIKPILIGVAIVFGLIVGAIAAVVVIGLALTAFMVGIPVAIGVALAAIVAFAAAGLSALVSWAEGGITAAESFIAGLVNGVKSGTGWVVSAIQGMGASAIAALKGVLHIGSPSRLMMKMGGFTAQGLAQGIDAGTGHVEAAAAGMAEAAIPKPTKGGASASGGGGKGGSTINVAAGAIVINGVGSSGEALTMTENALASLLERLAVSQGLGEPVT